VAADDAVDAVATSAAGGTGAVGGRALGAVGATCPKAEAAKTLNAAARRDVGVKVTRENDSTKPFSHGLAGVM